MVFFFFFLKQQQQNTDMWLVNYKGNLLWVVQ